MSGNPIACWKCDGVMSELLLPLSRTEECSHCGTDLHVCRMCRFYDTSVSNACLEPVADRVTDKTRANFCGYLELRKGVTSGASKSDAAADDLNALFGIEVDTNSTPSVDDLFGTDDSREG